MSSLGEMVNYKTALVCSKSDTPGFDYGIRYLRIASCWENNMTLLSFGLFLSKMGFIKWYLPHRIIAKIKWIM